VPHEHSAIDGASIAIVSSIIPEIEVLRANALTFRAVQRLEPWAAQALVLEHARAPQVEAHGRAAALDQLARNRHLRTEVQRVLRVTPNVSAALRSLAPVQAADAGVLRMQFHLLDQADDAVARRAVVCLDGQDVFPLAQVRVGQNLADAIAIRFADFLPEGKHPVDCLIGRESQTPVR